MNSTDGSRRNDPLEDALLDAVRRDEDRAIARGIRLEADRIASLILDGDASRAEVGEAVEALRREVLEVFPDGGELFDAIYLGRFRRMWEQFRPDEEPL